MVLNGFDSLKAFKAIAMGNYTRRRKLKWLFEICVFFFLFSRRSTWFSFVHSFLRQVFRHLAFVLNSHIYVFMFFNAMIFVVYSLSDLTDNRSATSRNDAAESTNDGQPALGTTAVGELDDSLEAPSNDSVEETRVVGEKNTVSPLKEVATAATPLAEEPTIPTVISTSISTSTLTSTSPVQHSNSASKSPEIMPEPKRYRRTESEKYEENRETRNFRRSKTEVKRESGGEPRRSSLSVDEMDIEDFNRTVESFIEELKLQQRVGWNPRESE